MPHISVILPTFNRKYFLKEAIESVLQQTYTDFELIIVDDGSNDGTREVVEQFLQNDKRITYVYQANRGVSAARNTGIKNSAGEFIAFIDSDDYWLKGKLETQIAFFDEHPDYSICQTEEVWIRNGRRVNPAKKHKKYAGYIFVQSLPLCIISPSAIMIRRAIFDSVGLFDEELPACEDYDMWLRITPRYPIGLISTPLIVKRGGHPDQLSSSIPHLDKYRIISIEKTLKSNILSPTNYEAAVKMLILKCEIYANGCKKHNKIEEANYYKKIQEKYSKT